MTTITEVLAVPAVGAYYYDDLAALQSQPMPLAERYAAPPVTPGFRRVREVAEAVSVGLVLDGGRVAWGDCVAVEFSGKAGRDPVFRADSGLAAIRDTVAPVLIGREVTTFRQLAEEVEALVESVDVMRQVPKRQGMTRRDLLTAPARALRLSQEEEKDAAPVEWVTVEQQLHTAIRYGVSQALLRAVAMSHGVTMAEAIAHEWHLPLPRSPVPIHAQCGADRFAGADKMIARRVASLPHTLVDNIPAQLGADGTVLTRYARWLKSRVEELGGPDYLPTIHLDVHGALGQIYDNQLGRVLGQLYALEQAVQPYPLRVECPVLMQSREEQIQTLRTLREYIQFRGMSVRIVADEWANTLEDIRAFIQPQAVDMIQVKMPDLGGVHHSVEAVLACKEGHVGAFLGGSCAETDLSARAAVHVALATQPEMMMAKPGMGVDEGITIVQNEMARTLAQIAMRIEAQDPA